MVQVKEGTARRASLGFLVGSLLVAASCSLPEREGREKSINLPPLVTSASNESGDSRGINVLCGLFQKDLHGDESRMQVLPFYFSSRGPGDNRFLFVFPFFYYNREPFRSDTFVLLFGRQRKAGRTIYHPLAPLISFSPADELGRKSFFLFPLVDLQKEPGRGRIDCLNLLGLVRGYGCRWGDPPPPGESGSRGDFYLLNVLGLFQLAGGNDRGAYYDFQVATLFGNERLSLYDRHWKMDGSEGRSVLFPFYWHFKDAKKETRWFWPLFSLSSGPGWSGTGFLSNIFTLKREGEKRTLKLFWLIPISWGEGNGGEPES